MKSGWFKKLSKGERIAIIGGIFAIVAGVLPVLILISFNEIKQPADSSPKLVDTNEIKQPADSSPKLVDTNEIKQPADSALQLVDIYFIDTNEFPKLEIVLRNTGEKVAFVKRANFGRVSNQLKYQCKKLQQEIE